MLKYTLVEPRPELPAMNGLIIMPNEIMAGLEDFHSARAHDVADATGMPVLAYERPLSASSATFDLSLRRHFTQNAASIQADTARQLVVDAGRESRADLYVTGHSAGASEAIGITATGILPIKHGVFTDPAAIRESFPVKAEAVDYGVYTIFTERRKPKDYFTDRKMNHQPEVHPSSSESLRRVLGEISIHSAYWRSADTKKALFRILGELPDTTINVYFPEHTFTATPEQLQELTEGLSGYRNNFKAEVLPGQYHSYFDDYKRFGRLVATALSQSHSS